MNNYAEQYLKTMSDDSVQYNFAEESGNKMFDSFKSSIDKWAEENFPKEFKALKEPFVEQLTKNLFDENGKAFLQIIINAAEESSSKLKEKIDSGSATPEEKEEYEVVEKVKKDKGKGFFKSLWSGLKSLISKITGKNK